ESGPDNAGLPYPPIRLPVTGRIAGCTHRSRLTFFELLRQAEPAWLKDARIHLAPGVGEGERCAHAPANVPFEIDARGDLPQFETVLPEAEHGPVRHIEHRLAELARAGRIERDLLHLLDEFRIAAFLLDDETAVADRGAQPTRRQ